MTAYFDAARKELYQAKALPQWEMWGAFRAIERRVVFDCTVAMANPEFPAELRRPLHTAVLKYGIESLPDNAPAADFETNEEHLRRLCNLVEDLHSVFHGVGTLSKWGDNPQSWVQSLAARGDEEREKMVDEEPSTAAHAAEWRRRWKEAMEGNMVVEEKLSGKLPEKPSEKPPEKPLGG